MSSRSSCLTKRFAPCFVRLNTKTCCQSLLRIKWLSKADLYGIERFIGELIPRAEEEGFEPVNPVAERALDARPLPAKKAKKKQPFNKPKSDSSKPNSKKPNNGGSGTGPRRGGSKKPAAKTDDNAQSPWAKRQSVGNGQRRRRSTNND